MIIHELSKFIVNLNYEDIPEKSIEKAKLCFIDYLAVYLRGLNTENSKIACKTIYGLYNKSNALNNAFLNGIASHSLDLDDGHRVAQLHPGTIVFSTILALVNNDSNALNISAKKFFESVIIGYEVSILLGMLVNPYHRNQGFHSTGTIGTIAAASVASKVLNLTQEQTEDTLGLSTTQSAGLLEADHAGTMGKSLHVGNAAYSGILSAYLAKNGFTGGESLIDGKEGFLNAMVYNLDNFNKSDEDSYNNIKEFLENNLGQFHINEVYLKKYPFCRHIHSAIDSSLALKEELLDYVNHYNDPDDFNSSSLDSSNSDSFNFNGSNFNGSGLGSSNSDSFNCDYAGNIDSYYDLINSIDSIDIKTYKIASEHDNYNPKTSQDLKQSLPYAVAISLVSNDLSLDSIDHLIEEGLLMEDTCDGEVLKVKELSNKINIVFDKELDELTPQKRPSKIEIKFADDSMNTIQDTTFYPLGENENPLSLDDILDKFELLNPKFNMAKLQIIKHVEDHSINEVLREIFK